MTTSSGFDLIPAGAKAVAALAFLAAVAFSFWIFDDHKAIGLGTAMGVAAGAITAAFILLTGYVYADAARRGMPPIPWTALVLLVPNGVGFVVYFLLRKPLVHPCSNCGCGVAQGAAFCSGCGHSQVNVGAATCRNSQTGYSLPGS
jgi:hypothetical protein